MRREVSPQGTLVKFNEPVTISGFYLGRERKKIDPFPEGWLYSVEDEDGQVWSFFGTKIIDDKFGPKGEERIDVGEYIDVVYEGKSAKTTKGTTIKFFRVFVGQEEEGESEKTAPTTKKETEDVPF